MSSCQRSPLVPSVLPCAESRRLLAGLGSQHLAAFHCLLFLYLRGRSVLARHTVPLSVSDETWNPLKNKERKAAATHRCHLSLHHLFYTVNSWASIYQAFTSPPEQSAMSYYRFVKQDYCDNGEKSKKAGLIAC